MIAEQCHHWTMHVFQLCSGLFLLAFFGLLFAMGLTLLKEMRKE